MERLEREGSYEHVARSASVSPSKVKLRDCKERSSMNRIKKLKRRISASFSKLSLSKEDNSSINGRYKDRCSDSEVINGQHYSSVDSSHSPPVCYPLGGSGGPPSHKPPPHPYRYLSQENPATQPVTHPAHQAVRQLHMTSSMDETLLLQHTTHNGGPPTMSSSYHAGDHTSPAHLTAATYSGSQQSKESGYYSNRPSYHEAQLESQHSHFTGAPHSSQEYSHHYLQTGQLQHPAVERLQHTPVKRHHSTGDMLEQQGHTVTTEEVRLRPVKHRPPRPKSDGNFIIEGFVPKRASSFGFNSPFGKAECYEKLDQLGEGSYATVYRGISRLTGKVVALKEIRLQQEEGAPFTAIREASLLKGLKHTNIVTLHDIIHTRDTLTFVFEFVHTDLSQYLEKHPGGLNPRNVKLLLFQLLRGLCFCHQRRILHRDLKPQNLLISQIGELKLADFGLARAKSIPSHTYSHEVVTLWYRPPDVLLGSTNYTTSLDMWGVGCIFTEVIAGSATFPGMKDAFDQLDRIWRVMGTPGEEEWEGVTGYPNYDLTKFGSYRRQRLSTIIPKLAHIPYAENLADSLIHIQPSRRITAHTAMHHRYFTDLPTQVYQLEDSRSLFDIPGVKLAPEMDQLLRTQIRTNPHTTARV